jgi:tRNA (guanine-N7-)-methyltransferase
MRPGAQFRFASDIADYAAMVNEGIAASPHFDPAPGLLPERHQDWPLTRYAEKAIEAGRRCQFFIFARNGHIS